MYGGKSRVVKDISDLTGDNNCPIYSKRIKGKVGV